MASLGANVSSYDVFLSFRGEDTRHSFTDHLYHALTQAGISSFRDDEEVRRGEELKPEIERAIKESKASIVVLSENYATSTWCLDELVLILDQRRECNHFVLPVFYHVDPADVRKQNKTFAIQVIKSCSRWTDHNVSKWKTALMEVANLAGLLLKGPETIFLKEIVDTIYNKIDRKEVHLPPNITGMATNYKEISSWLNSNIQILVICGMGGSGKTTLAKYIYDSIWKTFENVSFVEDIGSRCKGPNDLLELQEQLLKDILGGKRRKIPSVSRGTCKIEEALQMKRTLIVLDDIVVHGQFEALLGTGMINAQSKIIVTTREDMDNWFMLSNWSCQKYQIKLLNDDESLELLSRHAFRSKVPMAGFEELALQAVRYCEGNPLALEVLGSSLFKNNTIPNWKSQLNLLEKDIDSRIQGVLIRSYMSLPYEPVKELFLHIACFFIGIDIDYVEKILEPDYSANSGIKTLINRCLLSVSPNKKLMMHRLLQEMGKHIVRQESTKFPAERSRVWLSSDSYKILSKGKGSETMEGLALDMQILSEEKFAFKSSDLNTDALKKMDNLILLQLNFVELTGSYENFSVNLRWLCWIGFHLKSIPSDLYMGNLVAIDMSYSNLHEFEPPTVLQSLQILNLTDSHLLCEIRNISRIPHLETLILWNCYRLVHVCETIGELTSLALLNMTGCWNLCKREPTNLLVGLNASSSRGGVAGPIFSFPHSLHQLFLKDCNLECTDSFPLSFSVQPYLQYLNLGNSLFEFLPYYDHLKNLRVLDLSLCSKLKSLLCLPSTLAELYIYYCESLEKITFQSHQFTLQEFGYEGCINLYEIEGFIKLVPIVKLHETDLGHMKWLKEYQNYEVCLVGDDELTIGRNCHVQMLYEFSIMSTSLPDIKDPTMTPKFISESSSLSFGVPSCPKNRRLKGLNVTFKYSISDKDCAWFAKISTTNGVDLMYNPKVFGKPGVGEVGIWLSYWPIGHALDTGDEVIVSIAVISGLEVHECGANLVYTDDEVGKESFENDMGWVDILGGDLSGFQLSTGAYYLCRRDFYELMEVGRLTPGWFRILVGDSIDYTEVRGWRKTGRSKQLNQSFTELKTVRCIIDGPELEDIYKIADMSKSSLGDKTVAFTSSSVEEEMKSGTRSELIDAAIEEIYNKQYMSDDEIVPNSFFTWFDDVMTEEPYRYPPESASRPKGEILKSVLTHEVSGPEMKKIVVGVNFGSQNKKLKAIKALYALQGIQSIADDTKDGTLTIIGNVDPMRVLFLLNKFDNAQIISVGPEYGPAEEYETEVGGPSYESVKEHETRPFSKNISVDSTSSIEMSPVFEKVPEMRPKLDRIGSVHLTMSQVARATQNFSPLLRLGEGWFGTVYQAQLNDGQVVAIKRAKKEHFDALRNEFRSEVELLAKIDHRNLVKLLGYLDKGNERLIITEYVPNGTLREHLDGGHGSFLDFSQRLEICIDIAHGLTYLHLYAEKQIIHRDVKSSNILLTERLRAKVADFGFARLGDTETDNTHVVTKVRGTIGYLDPEYLRTYHLTPKSDVYSFGVLLIEILTGRRPIETRRSPEERVTIRWALGKYNEGKIMDLVDPRMKDAVDSEIFAKMLGLAFQCAALTGVDRPEMKVVGEQLWVIRMDYFRQGRSG